MKLSAERYTPQIVVNELRKSAITAWSVGFSAAFVWLLLILLAPVAEIFNLTYISKPLYAFFSYLCHQLPERSFHLDEHALAVCSRCFGVYFGLFAGFMLYPVFRNVSETEPLSRIWLFLALVPMGVDWGLTAFGIWENTHWSRFLTGAILGAACAVFIIPALVEIFLLLRRRHQKKAVA